LLRTRRRGAGSAAGDIVAATIGGGVAVTDVIAKKRDGQELSAAEIAEVVDGFLRGVISEGAMGALLMAILLRGMTEREVADLTLAMTRSGDTLDLSSIPGLKVDKHSTGGVGDKTTLVVAPLVAALGVPVPKLSGRSLGHTGGTIDKLECLPGLTTRLPPERFCRQVADIGVAIASQSETMAPADGKLYALRDATATVESIPLIAASVMCKKLAVGADALVLDVKAGAGAFITQEEQALELARLMVGIGARAGKRVTALVTRMDQPLGEAVGDVVELQEAVATLSGHGPADFVELCELVAGHMLALGGGARNPEEGRLRARQGLRSGAGLSKLKAMVQAQGGEAAALEDPARLLQDSERLAVHLPSEGYLTALDARQIGLAVRDLKTIAGPRKSQCGLLLSRKVGDRIAPGPVATVLAPVGLRPAMERAAHAVVQAFRTEARPPRSSPLMIGVIHQDAASDATPPAGASGGPG
jgi:pyrimidine-nucleoside phosphorylase